MKVLLDIDGVVAPFDLPPTHSVAGSEIHIPDIMPGLVLELHRRFELVWCSMWEEDSNLVGEVLGLPRLSWVRMPRRVLSDQKTLKLPAVKAWDPGVDLIWIDDDLFGDAEDWAGRRGSHTRLIRTDPAVGLTREIVEELGLTYT